MLASKEDTIQIAWADNQSETFVQIYGIGVTEADMIRVAENIILK